MTSKYRGTYVTQGPPGSGKTRWLAQRVPGIVDAARGPFGGIPKGKYPALICSLTKAAATEIASRCPDLPKEAVATLHAHCYRSLEEQREVFNTKDLKEWNSYHPSDELSTSLFNGETYVDSSGNKPGDERYRKLMVLRNRMIPRELWPADVYGFSRNWEAFKEDKRILDFTDMLEMAGDRPPGRPDVIIVDEAQDLSRLGFSVIRRWGECAQATLVVGDPRQSLYTWAGADPGILTSKDYPADHRGVLSQSYRLPAVLVDLAQRWARGFSDWSPIDYRPRKGDPGTIRRSFSTYRQPASAIRMAEEYLDAGKSVMFAAHTNRMVSHVVNELRGRAIPYSNPWRRQNSFWNPLSRRHGEAIADGIAGLLSKDWTTTGTAAWVRRCRAKGLVKRGMKTEIEEAAERKARPVEFEELTKWFEPEPLIELLEARDRGDYSWLLYWWRDHLAKGQKISLEYYMKLIKTHGVGVLEQVPKLYVGTIHSFKGAEADVVFLFPDVSGLAWKQWRGSPEDRDAVIRLFYVGITRARETLVICQRTRRKAVWLPA